MIADDCQPASVALIPPLHTLTAVCCNTFQINHSPMRLELRQGRGEVVLTRFEFRCGLKRRRGLAALMNAPAREEGSGHAGQSDMPHSSRGRESTDNAFSFSAQLPPPVMITIARAAPAQTVGLIHPGHDLKLSRQIPGSIPAKRFSGP
jgi:hypothetical protein